MHTLYLPLQHQRKTSPLVNLHMTRSEILTIVFTQLRNAGIVRNKTDFANKLRYDNSYLSSRFTGNREISNKTFDRISEVFPQVNKNFLFTGEGEILCSSCGTRIIVRNSREDVVGDSFIDALLAKRNELMQHLERINQAIELLRPRDMKNAS